MSLQAQVSFEEMAQPLGIDLPKSYGAAIIDYDNDGINDLFMTGRSSRLRLYRGQEDQTFEDVTQLAGLFVPGIFYQCSWADINNDGFVDLYVGNKNNFANLLFLNNGDGTFSEIGESAGVDNRGHTLSNLFSDVDGDGWIDLYLAIPKKPNVLYKNNGDLTFTEITESAGAVDTLSAMGSGFFDFDNDGDQDLYLVHDNNQANILYENDGEGHFTDISEKSGTNYQGLGMGVDFGDYDNDGYQDLYITNMFSNVLYHNNGDGTFTNVTEQAGVGDEGMGWGVTWLDYDNDGWEDLFVTNDAIFLEPYNVLYRNLGDGTFEPVSRNSVFEGRRASYSVAAGDINQDGKIDLWVSNPASVERAQLFVNHESGGNYVTFRLEGTESNRTAIGARMVIHLPNQKLTKEIRGGMGYAQQNSPELHFGLGENTVVPRVEVFWPSGAYQQFEQVAANQRLALTEGEQPGVVKDNSGTFVVTSTDEDVINSLPMVYPNPASQYLTIDLKQLPAPLRAIEFMDSSGQKKAVSTTMADNAVTLDVSGHSSGLHLLVLHLKNGSRHLEKVLIQR